MCSRGGKYMEKIVDIPTISSRLSCEVDINTLLLDDLVRGSIIKPCNKENENLLKFIVARKWNSWYPCYFDTEGGCYGIMTRDSQSDPLKNSGIIIIDPGIKFINNLRNLYNIEPHDIKSVITSHFHPDHAMGLFELLTLSHETRYSCSYYLNKTAYYAFKAFEGKYSKILELNKDQVVKLADYEYESDDSEILSEEIYLKTLKTFHEEIGSRHNCLGFSFSFRTQNREDREIVLLGDTDGNEKYHERYLGYMKDASAIILHMGSYSERGSGKGNKHLYKNGLLDIINCINCCRGGKIPLIEGKIEKCVENGKISITPGSKASIMIPCQLHKQKYFENLQLVIISEFGLEMAGLDEFLNSIRGFKWFKNIYPLLILAKFFNKNDTYVNNFLKRLDYLKIDEKEKKRIPLEVFSTLAIKSLIQLSLSKVGSRKEDIESLHIYDNMMLLSIYVWYITLSEIDQITWRRLLNPHPIIENSEKELNDLKSKLTAAKSNKQKKELTEEIQKITKKITDLNDKADIEFSSMGAMDKIKIIADEMENIATDKFKVDSAQYTEFIEYFDLIMGREKEIFFELIDKYKDILFKFFNEILINVCDNEAINKSPQCLMDLSKDLFFAIRSMKHYGRMEKDNSIEENLTFARSISLFSEENKSIVDYIKENYNNNDETYDTILYILSYGLNKYSTSIIPTDIIRTKTNGWDINENIIKILREYSGGGLKFFFSTLGLEVDLSDENLRIRSNPKENFIELNSAKQELSGKIKRIS